MKKKITQNTNTADVKYCTADGNVLLQSGQPKRFSKSAALLVSAAIILSAALFALGLYFLVDKVDHAAAKADEAILQEKSSEATDIDLANALRTSAADRVLADETIPAYSNAQVRSMDVSKPSGVTEAELKLITKGNLKGLEGSFVKAEKDYGVNCLFVVAIASLESADGTICFKPTTCSGSAAADFRQRLNASTWCLRLWRRIICGRADLCTAVKPFLT